MLYNFNGKNIRIPDETIKNYIEKLGLSQNEAIQTYLEDEGYLENEEVEILTSKAKVNKAVKHEAKAEKPKKEAVKRERKPDEEKILIIKGLADFLSTQNYEPIISNPSKIIEFCVGDNYYKLDLIKKRPQKVEKA